MNELIGRVAKAPLAVKVGSVAAAIVLLTAANYFLFSLPAGPSIADLETKIQRAGKEQEKLDREFIEKTAIANNLNQFRREKELLESRLKEALSELPEAKNMDELLQMFQDRAVKAGLEIGTIEPQAARTEGFYAAIPIPMTVTGNFHEVATFFDSLGRLQRIVNVSDITLGAPKDVAGKMVVNAKFLVTTFMFVDQAKAAPEAGKKKGKR